MFSRFPFLAVGAFIAMTAFFVSCSQSPITPEETDVIGSVENDQSLTWTDDDFAAAATLNEGFETGSKTSYAVASVTLGSGSWSLDEALIGNSSSDRRNGVASARVRETGKITMNFNKTSGIGTVSVRSAVYGSDAASAYDVYFSTNGGSTWTRIGTSSTTVSGTTLSSKTFTVNNATANRIQIRKVSGAANRINIDDIQITDYVSSGGGTTPPPTPSTVHLSLGNPSNATTDVAFPTNYLLANAQYAFSYNRDKAIPNWVAWHLDPSYIGSAQRQDDFREDTRIPSTWYRVQGTSYSGSGFDRGHMCPSADRTATIADNSATFLMTNMIPQAPDNNQGIWANLENYTRTLVQAGNEVYIVCGAYGQGGTGSNGAASTLDAGRIVVPARTWKVLVVIPQGTNDVSRISTSTRVIAVDIPNTQGVRTASWGSYRVSVDVIEQRTGFDIMSLVPASIQSTIEARVDNGPLQ